MAKPNDIVDNMDTVIAELAAIRGDLVRQGAYDTDMVIYLLTVALDAAKDVRRDRKIREARRGS